MTHRYTLWIPWPTRQIIAEELYDYTSGPSTRHEGALDRKGKHRRALRAVGHATER